jgi:hypothetical protein
MERNMTDMTPDDFFQTKLRGTHEQEFEIFLAFADDGNGGDITNGGAPLPTFDEWMAR